jgi:protein-S-isoprenylcysteine O-methyltransferase Ste14
LLLTASWYAKHPLLLVIEGLGVLMGSLAVFQVMQRSKLRVQPEVHPQASLVQDGVYKLVRHPMYFSIIITFIPLLISYFSVDRLVVYLVLFVNLIFKIRYEESLLQQRFPEYQLVHAQTKRLIPFVW